MYKSTDSLVVGGDVGEMDVEDVEPTNELNTRQQHDLDTFAPQHKLTGSRRHHTAAFTAALKPFAAFALFAVGETNITIRSD